MHLFHSSRARTATIGAIAALALVLTGCSSHEFEATDDNSQTLTASHRTAIDEAVGNAMQWSRSTQAIVGVWSSAGDYVRGYSADGATEVDGNTVFRATQTMQPVLCALLLDTVDRGVLKLDREVTRDVPRLIGIGDVTYAQLCDGTAGFADFKANFNDDFVMNPTRVWPAKEFISESLIKKRLSWPGLDVHRSDTNALILAHALTVVGKQPIDEQLMERVFIPANLPHTTVPANTELTLPGDNVLTGLSYPPGPNCEADALTIEQVSPTMLGAAAPVNSSVGDIKRFFEAYLSGAFGGDTAKLITEKRSLQNPERDAEGNPVESDEEPSPMQSYYGFGLTNVGPLWGAAGQMPGTITSAWHDPQTGFTVVVVLNNSSATDSLATHLAFQIAAQLGQVDELWTPEERTESMQALAVCQEPPAEEAAE